MSIYMHPTNQKFGLWCGAIFLLCFTSGLAFVAPLVPPVSPADSAEEVAEFFRDNAWRIKLGCLVTMLGAACQVPLFLTLSCQLARTERGVPIMAINQFAVASFNAAFFILGPVIWVTVAFRPDIAPELARSINDLGWITYFFIISPAILQNVCIAWAIFGDHNETPILPRWYAYLNLWVAMTYIPAGLVPFFKVGPFAWDGLVSFWIVVIDFAVWTLAMIYVCYRAIRQQQTESSLRAM